MSPTSVVNISDKPRPRFDVYAGRSGNPSSGYFGNPYVIGIAPGHSRTAVIQLFASYAAAKVQNDAAYREAVKGLQGKVLGCFCVDKPWTLGDPGPIVCHAQILAMMADA